MSGQVIVISGPSGVGKGTLIRELLAARPDLRLTVSATTRKSRAGEVDGIDYYFLTREQFMKRVSLGAFAEWCEVHGNLYGTLREEIDKWVRTGDNVLLEIDIQGAAKVRALYSDLVSIFIVPPSESVLLSRLQLRNTEDPEAVQRRLVTAREELREQSQYHYVIVNQEISRAVSDLVRVVDEILQKGA